MTKAAKMNGKPVDLSRHVIRKTTETEEEVEELGFSDLFSSDIWLITTAMILLWPIVTLAYFGLGLSMTQLGGDIFVSFILGALTEVGGCDASTPRSRDTPSASSSSTSGAGNLSSPCKVDHDHMRRP